MGKKKGDSGSINLDSFLDIMTCLVGVLVLIIILTSIDASQTKVLVPTPMAHVTGKRRVFIECRDNKLYHIDLDEINNSVQKKFEEIDADAEGNASDILAKVENLDAETDSYIIDLSYALVGQVALAPKDDVEGQSLDNVNFQSIESLTIGGWLEELLRELEPESDIITFLVRDDSFDVFKKARALAWLLKIQCSYELMDVDDPIKFGLGGTLSLAQ